MRVSSEFATALTADVLHVAFFVEMAFRTETVRLWSGPADITFDGNTYIAVGAMGRISNVTESALPGARGIEVSLIANATSVYQAAAADSRNIKGRPLKLWFALMNEAFTAVAHSYQLNEYKMNVLKVEDIIGGDGGTRISIEAEHELLDLFQGSAAYYSNEDQKRIHPDDTFFRYITTLPEKDITWKPDGKVGYRPNPYRPGVISVRP